MTGLHDQTEVIMLATSTFIIADATSAAELYCQCFAEEPWFEVFDPEVVAREFIEMLEWDDSILLVCRNGGRVVGMTVGYAMWRRQDIRDAIGVSSIDESDYYFAELFVHPDFRGEDMASLLWAARTKIARQEGFSRATGRTSEKQSIIIEMYLRRGFKIVAKQNVTSSKVLGGKKEEVSDPRVILMGSLAT